MNTLSSEDLVQVSGGVIGGATPNGIPLVDASGTRMPGQNSYGETLPGAMTFYGEVLRTGEAQITRDIALATQLNSCGAGASLGCLISTINAINAIDSTVVRTPYIKGPQGK